MCALADATLASSVPGLEVRRIPSLGHLCKDIWRRWALVGANMFKRGIISHARCFLVEWFRVCSLSGKRVETNHMECALRNEYHCKSMCVLMF